MWKKHWERFLSACFRPKIIRFDLKPLRLQAGVQTRQQPFGEVLGRNVQFMF